MLEKIQQPKNIFTANRLYVEYLLTKTVKTLKCTYITSLALIKLIITVVCWMTSPSNKYQIHKFNRTFDNMIYLESINFDHKY